MNTSHVWTIQESNAEKLLVYKATQFRWGGRVTNDRPRTDHVISGPMIGLRKGELTSHTQTDRQIDMLTL